MCCNYGSARIGSIGSKLLWIVPDLSVVWVEQLSTDWKIENFINRPGRKIILISGVEKLNFHTMRMSLQVTNVGTAG